MPPTTEEITGVFLREVWRRDEFAIAKIRVVSAPVAGGAVAAGAEAAAQKPIARRRPVRLGDGQFRAAPAPDEFSIKGNWEPDELKAQLEYNFYGHWESPNKFGRDFAFKTFVRAQPHGRAGVIRYLCEAPHIGQATAEALWNKFGSDAVRIVRESPDVAAAAVNRLPLPKAQQAAEFLADMSALENCTIDLIDLLAGYRFPKSLVREAPKRWGNRATAIISKDPHKLLAFRGCGFKTVDKMYIDLGLPPGKLKRQAYCGAYALQSDTQGHTWHPLEKAVGAIRAAVSGAEIEPAKALSLAKRGRIISSRRDQEGKIWLADFRKSEDENYVARKVAAAMAEKSNWPKIVAAKDGQPGPTEHQAEEMNKATAGALGVFAGLPGSGKSFTLAYLVRAVMAKHGAGCIAIAAPTGKAAVRMTEAMGASGVPFAASTTHRLLGVNKVDGGQWDFVHGEKNPLPFRFLVLDEWSMGACDLTASVMAARARGCNVLFIGDIAQLPPVGHGAPLRDFIAAGLPYGRLTSIHRNAGTIVKCCKAIAEGKPLITDDTLDPFGDPPRNLKLIPATNEQAPEKILELVRQIRASGLMDPVWDVQVIVAVNKKGSLSRRELNKQLQTELNPNGEKVAGSPFRVGDKIGCLKNSYFSTVEDVDDGDEVAFDEKMRVLVCNGEFGRVLEVAEKKTVIEIKNPRRVILVPRGKQEGDGGDSDSEDATSTGCDFDLAYAVTCHKMQGSQAPLVIVALDEHSTGKYGVAKREWLFTGSSRAEKVCFWVGKLSTARAMCAERALPLRKTFLVEQIAHYRAEFVAQATRDAELSGRRELESAAAE